MNTFGPRAKTLVCLKHRNFNIPDFFILDTTDFYQFLSLKEEEAEAFWIRISEKIRTLGSGPWIIRPRLSIDGMNSPSLQSLFQASSTLNTAQEVLMALAKLWQQACSQDFENRLTEKAKGHSDFQIDLVIQNKIAFDQKGILMTVHPDSGDDKQLLIETYQTKDLQPSTAEVPLTKYTLSWFKPELIICGENVNRAPLSTQQLVLLREIGAQLHSLFQAPQKIEFGIHQGRVYLLDSQNMTETPIPLTLEGWLPSEFRGNEKNSGIALPLMSSLYGPILSKSLNDYLHQWGLASLEELRNLSWHQTFGGREFWNQRAFINQWKTVAFFDANQWDDFLGVNSEPTNPKVPRLQRPLSFASIWMGLQLRFRTLFVYRRHLQTSGEQLVQTKEALRQHSSVALKNPTKDVLQAEWKSLVADYRMAEEQFLKSSLFTMAAQLRFRQTLRPYLKATPTLDEWTLLSDIGSLDSLALIKTLRKLARQVKTAKLEGLLLELIDKTEPLTYTDLDRFPSEIQISLKELVDNYGYLSDDDLDLRAPRWSYELRLCLTALARYANGFSDLPERKKTEASNSFEDMLQRLKETHVLTLLGFVPGALDRTLRHLNELRRLILLKNEWREITSKFYDRIQAFVFQLAQEESLKEVLRENPNLLFFATADDISSYLNNETEAESLVARASKEKMFLDGYQNGRSLSLINRPSLIGSKNPSLSGTPSVEAEEAPTTLVGASASSGRIRGRARLLTKPSDLMEFKKGDILITPTLSMGWAPFYALAGGVICESGKPLDFNSQLAREFHIPLVCGVEKAHQTIQSGQEIEIDGTGGEIYLNENF